MSDRPVKLGHHAERHSGKPKEDHSASYFSHSDQKASQVREKLAEESLEALIAWLKKEGNVGIMGEYRQNPVAMTKLTGRRDK